MDFNIQRTHGIIHIGKKKQAGLATGLKVETERESGGDD